MLISSPELQSESSMADPTVELPSETDRVAPNAELPPKAESSVFERCCMSSAFQGALSQISQIYVSSCTVYTHVLSMVCFLLFGKK